jgi:protein SCO1/2
MYFIKGLAALSIVILMVGCDQKHSVESRTDTLPYYMDEAFTPIWLDPNSAEVDAFHQIADFSLTNQEGQIITQDSFDDKIYVTDFFFTYCTGICPKMTENMSLVQEAFKNDDSVMMLSHSVTPEHDTPEILQEYAKAKGVIKNKWHLVTGERSQIYDLGRNSYFVEEDLGLDKGPDDFLHTENFVLIDSNKHIRGIYNGLNKTAIQQLIADIKTLQLE